MDENEEEEEEDDYNEDGSPRRVRPPTSCCTRPGRRRSPPQAAPSWGGIPLAPDGTIPPRPSNDDGGRMKAHQMRKDGASCDGERGHREGGKGEIDGREIMM